MTYEPCDCDYCQSKNRRKSYSSPCECKSGKKDPRELLASIINMENALAEAIETECGILKKGNYTPQELNHLLNRLEELIKLAIKKEIMLEFLLEDLKFAGFKYGKNKPEKH